MSRSRDCVSTRPSCTEVGRKVKPWRKKEPAYQRNTTRSECGHLHEPTRAPVPCAPRRGSSRPPIGAPPRPEHRETERGARTEVLPGRVVPTPDTGRQQPHHGSWNERPARPLNDTCRAVPSEWPGRLGFHALASVLAQPTGHPSRMPRRSHSSRSRLFSSLPERFSRRSESGFRWSAVPRSRYRRLRAARLRHPC